MGLFHHTPTGGSTVVVAISVPLPYGLFLMELIDLPFHGSAYVFHKNINKIKKNSFFTIAFF
jgi:hypothetical protein